MQPLVFLRKFYIRIHSYISKTTEPEVALESTSRILNDEQETTEPEVVLETKESEKHDELMSIESTKSCETNKHITETELPYTSIECYGQDVDEDQFLMDENTDNEPERTPLASEMLLLGQIPTSDFKEFMNYATWKEENYQKALCLICQEDEVKEFF